MKKTKFYGVVSTSKKAREVARTKDSKGRWSSEVQEISRPIDILVTSDFTNRIDALNDIEAQAAKLGTLKFTSAFK